MTATRVDVFLADTRAHDCESLATKLDPMSLERLAKITHPRRRAQFILGRILLRQALHQEYGAATEIWSLDATHGKPRMVGMGVPEISLSHSRQLVACAIAPVAIGIDLEYCRERDFAALVEQFFPPSELRLFRALPAADRTMGFYRLWTRHEAVFKLYGGVLSASNADAAGWSKSHAYFQPAENFLGAIVALTHNPIQVILHSQLHALHGMFWLRD